jgi:hypothetical protein
MYTLAGNFVAPISNFRFVAACFFVYDVERLNYTHRTRDIASIMYSAFSPRSRIIIARDNEDDTDNKLANHRRTMSESMTVKAARRTNCGQE